MRPVAQGPAFMRRRPRSGVPGPTMPCAWLWCPGVWLRDPRVAPRSAVNAACARQRLLAKRVAEIERQTAAAGAARPTAPAPSAARISPEELEAPEEGAVPEIKEAIDTHTAQN